MLYIILLLMFLSFAGGGIIIRELKAYDLIAGYNTMPDDEKTQYDIESVRKILPVFIIYNVVMIASLIPAFLKLLKKLL